MSRKANKKAWRELQGLRLLQTSDFRPSSPSRIGMRAHCVDAECFEDGPIGRRAAPRAIALMERASTEGPSHLRTSGGTDLFRRSEKLRFICAGLLELFKGAFVLLELLSGLAKLSL